MASSSSAPVQNPSSADKIPLFRPSAEASEEFIKACEDVGLSIKFMDPATAGKSLPDIQMFTHMDPKDWPRRFLPPRKEIGGTFWATVTLPLNILTAPGLFNMSDTLDSVTSAVQKTKRVQRAASEAISMSFVDTLRFSGFQAAQKAVASMVRDFERTFRSVSSGSHLEGNVKQWWKHGDFDPGATIRLGRNMDLDHADSSTPPWHSFHSHPGDLEGPPSDPVRLLSQLGRARREAAVNETIEYCLSGTAASNLIKQIEIELSSVDNPRILTETRRWLSEFDG